MKAEHTIDKPARAGRATQIAAMVITGLVAFIWVYFGRLYLIHDPDEFRFCDRPRFPQHTAHELQQRAILPPDAGFLNSAPAEPDNGP